MPGVKSLSAIKEKWTRVTPMRSEDYKIGVSAPRRDWADAAKAQEGTYKAAVMDAANKGRYGKGIDAAGTGKWKEKALQKGPGRFAEGVMLAGPEYEKGFAPMRETIERTTLPPRFPKGDPRNIQRVSVMATALREAKVGK